MIEVFKGIKLLSGINTHPGSGPPDNHKYEYKLFKRHLRFIRNRNNPTMLEIGSFWGLWSLVFRKKFPNGKNLLVELGKRQLSVGEKNFELNGFNQISYWGGFFLNDSGTYLNRKNDLEYPKVEGEYFDESIDNDNVVGPELDLNNILKNEKVDHLDLLHMDIQGSELKVIEYIFNSEFKINIDNFIIATHSDEIHNQIKSIISNSYHIVKEDEGVGGDGLLCLTKKNNFSTFKFLTKKYIL